ncbi:hypothetical protein CsSME_00041578 [Camellia sinensis var. sinensis]
MASLLQKPTPPKTSLLSPFTPFHFIPFPSSTSISPIEPHKNIPTHKQHFNRGFDQQWLSLTFSKAIFLGNGLVAIVAGLFGNLLVDSLNLGPVAPFDAAAGAAVAIASDGSGILGLSLD